MATPVAVGRADAAEAHLVSSEKGDHEGLLVLRAVASHQPCQTGVPSPACRGRHREPN